MVDLIETFAETIEEQDLVLFYFAGHGFHYKEQNYFVPIDAAPRIKSEAHIKNHCIDMENTSHLLADRTSNVIICIPDCSQTYLFDDLTKYQSFQKTGAGLHEFAVPQGTWIQFPCAPDTLTADRGHENRRGLFTKHLLKHLSVPNKHLDEIFASVTAGVYAESGKRQLPFRSSSIMIDELIYLNTKSDNVDTVETSSPVFAEVLNQQNPPRAIGIDLGTSFSVS